MNGNSKGLLLGSVAAVLWGSTYVVIRLLYQISDLDPVGVTFARFLIGGVALAGVLAARGDAHRLRAFVDDPIPFFWLGLTGIAGMGILAAIGSMLTSASNVSLILNANPIFIALLAPLIGERLAGARLAGAAIGLAGVAVVLLAAAPAEASAAGRHDLWGVAAAAGAALTWALYTLMGRHIVHRYGGTVTTTLAMLWGALLLAVVLPTAHIPRDLPLEAALLLLYLGLVPSALAFALWYRALAHVEAGVLAPTQYIAPPVTVLLAWVFLGERIGGAFLIGFALIVTGIALASRREWIPSRPS